MSSAQAVEWCFVESEASGLVYELDKYDNCTESLGLCLQANDTLEQKSKIQDEINTMKDELISLKDEQIAVKDKIIESHKELEGIKDKQIEAAKPSFWDKMGWRAEGAVIWTIILTIGAIAVL